MKMKRTILFSLSLFVIVSLIVTACKKKEEPATPEVQSYTKADDASARNELDRVQDDIESVYNSQEYAAARTAGVNLPCGKVTLSGKNFSIKYSGVNCGTRVLSGSINVTLLPGTTSFSDVDAKLQVDFVNYRVYYYSSKETLTYNGTTYIKNLTGGTLASLFTTTPGTVIHQVRGALDVKFDTLGTSPIVRTWNLFRKKTFDSDGTPTGISLKFEGDTIVNTDTYIPGTYSNVCAYGEDIKGLKFVQEIPTPFVWSNCGVGYKGPYILKQGKVVHTADASTTALGANWIYQFTAVAGYSLGTSDYVPDGTCTSNAYMMLWEAKNTATSAVLVSRSAFQPY
jgi:hypothetical protein